jgi:hypothetical protein
MRIGTMEGSPQEIRDLIENNGLRVADYLQPPEAQLQRRWLIIPTSLVGVALLLIILAGDISSKVLVLLLVLGFGGGTWLTVSVQIRFRNALATFAVAVGVVLTLLVAGGLIAPNETVDYLRKLRQPGP